MLATTTFMYAAVSPTVFTVFKFKPVLKFIYKTSYHTIIDFFVSFGKTIHNIVVRVAMESLIHNVYENNIYVH